MTRSTLPVKRDSLSIVLSVFVFITMVALLPGRASAQSTCFSTWTATAIYTGGQTASLNGELYGELVDPGQ
jgi:hypothetical protein